MGWAGAVDACRAGHLLLAILLHEVAAVGGVVGLLRCCESGLGRVHVEKEAVAADDEGASIAGGKRDAKALAGHSALRVSMLSVWNWWGSRRGSCLRKRAPRTFRLDVAAAARGTALAIAEKPRLECLKQMTPLQSVDDDQRTMEDNALV